MKFELTKVIAAIFAALIIGTGGLADAQSAPSNFRLNIPAQGGAPASRTFMVFFDYDSAALSSIARDLLARIKTMSDQNGAFVTITGHTDTAGSRFYNLGLSRQWAIAVRDDLVRRGVLANRIQVYWRGEFEPLVPTGDDVAEFRNRRNEIRFN